MCDTSDAGVTGICFSMTRRLKHLLTRGGVGLVGKTNYVNLVTTASSTTLTTNNAIAKMVPRFVIRRK